MDHMKEEYDHQEVRCAAMEDCDHDQKLVGEPRTCCVCIGHGCAEALAEIARCKAGDSTALTNLQNVIK